MGNKKKEVSRKYDSYIFNSYESSILFPNPTVTVAGKEIPTSKKDPSVRRKELLKHLKVPLIDMCVQHAAELLRSGPGARVLIDVYAAFQPGKLVDAVVDACSDALSDIKSQKDKKDDEEGKLPFLFDYNADHSPIKRLLYFDAAAEQPLFAPKLYAILKTNLLEIVTQFRGSFVICALCTVPVIGSAVKEELKPHKDVIRKLIRDQNGEKKGDTEDGSEEKITITIKGYESLLEEINRK